MTILNEKVIDFCGEGSNKNRVVAEIEVDSMSEVPGVTDIDGRTLVQGTLVHIIREGIIIMLGGDGKWYSASGELVIGTDTDTDE